MICAYSSFCLCNGLGPDPTDIWRIRSKCCRLRMIGATVRGIDLGCQEALHSLCWWHVIIQTQFGCPGRMYTMNILPPDPYNEVIQNKVIVFAACCSCYWSVLWYGVSQCTSLLKKENAQIWVLITLDGCQFRRKSNQARSPLIFFHAYTCGWNDAEVLVSNEGISGGCDAYKVGTWSNWLSIMF